MAKNTGKSLEQLVQEIYQAFLDYDSTEGEFRKISVQHNVTLDGKFGNTHQIDVYWEFRLATTLYRTIVEVKDWNTPVKQEQIMSFKSVLDDIPGATKGIYVSKCGYQEGAKKYAEAHGITLFQIDTDLDSPSFTIHFNETVTHYDEPWVEVDKEWLDTKAIQWDAVSKIVPQKAYEEAIFINPSGTPVNVFKLMCTEAVPYYYAPDNERHQIVIDLADDWYWETEDPNIPYVKISRFHYQCYNTSSNSLILLRIKDFPNCIIRDIQSGQKHTYNSFSKEIKINVN